MLEQTITSKECVDYVKDHVSRDIKLNEMISGEDYSMLFGTILEGYLLFPVSQEVMMTSAMQTFEQLGQREVQKTGKRFMYIETIKCAGPVHILYSRGDRGSFEELRKYAKELQGLSYKPLPTFDEPKSQVAYQETKTLAEKTEEKLSLGQRIWNFLSKER